MKNMKILSMLFALTAVQLHGSANPELQFILASQSAATLENMIGADKDDHAALSLIAAMQQCIDFDKKYNQEIKGYTDYIFKTKTSIDSLQKADKDLANRIDTLGHNISKLKQGGLTLGEKKKADNRRDERKDKQKEIDKNKAKILADKDLIETTQGKSDALNLLLKQNMVAFEDALDNYITSLGLFYVDGTSASISSKRFPGSPITPNEYNALIATLQSALSQFESKDATGNLTRNIEVTLDLMDGASSSEQSLALPDIIACLSNVAPKAGFNYTRLALGLAAVTAIAIGANAYVNNSQGKDLFDTSIVQSLGLDAINGIKTSSVGQSVGTAAANAASSISEATAPFINSAYSKGAEATALTMALLEQGSTGFFAFLQSSGINDAVKSGSDYLAQKMVSNSSGM